MIIQKRIFKSGTILIVSLLFFNCVFAQKIDSLASGRWSGKLQLNDSIILPFNFEAKNHSLELINGAERILVDDIMFKNDSVIIKMPLFDSEFRCKNSGNTLKGVWINHNRKEKNIIPFTAFHNYRKRCGYDDGPYYDGSSPINGKWECDFSPNSNDASKAVGIFKQAAHIRFFEGTFFTETGDYRYLEGEISEDMGFRLSCFDGAHAFLFTGRVKGNRIINGHFYSGAHSHETWIAKRNDKFQLRNPDSLTYLKPGYTKIDFSFKNLEGKPVSLSDDKYKNKVVIIQLMGTWCPNCMDETKFLAPFYDTYKAKGLEIIGLAFERTDDFATAVSRINRLKSKFNVNYDLLITMKTGSLQASEALPMLNKVMAFPTTIYIDKKGVVRKIYTGFYGPATGDSYTKYTEETTRFVEKLLSE